MFSGPPVSQPQTAVLVVFKGMLAMCDRRRVPILLGYLGAVVGCRAHVSGDSKQTAERRYDALNYHRQR